MPKHIVKERDGSLTEYTEEEWAAKQNGELVMGGCMAVIVVAIVFGIKIYSWFSTL